MLGRFGQADPITEDPFGTQGWNRYAYVGNSPVNFTDPSGYCFMGCFWKGAFAAIGNFLRKNPIIGKLLTIAFAAMCGPNAPVCAAVVSSLTSAFVTGVTSGSLGAGLRAGLISAVTAFAFFGVGEITGHAPAFGTTQHIINVAGHAGVGCLSAMAAGGKCGAGALSAAAGSFASPFMNTGSHAGNIAAHAVVGGVASVAGGGKFMDGAVTAAFGYMFNSDGLKWSDNETFDASSSRDYACTVKPGLCGQNASGRAEDASWIVDALGGGVGAGLAVRSAYASAAAASRVAEAEVATMGNAAFGKFVEWGARPEGAMAAIRNMTPEFLAGLEARGMTIATAERWANMYSSVMWKGGKFNETAFYREIYMRNMIGQLRR